MSLLVLSGMETVNIGAMFAPGRFCISISSASPVPLLIGNILLPPHGLRCPTMNTLSRFWGTPKFLELQFVILETFYSLVLTVHFL